jgi:hypothetical protein
MIQQNWRIDNIGTGALAWLYIRPHQADWHDACGAVREQGYSITEETQNLVDGELGACLRYLAVRVRRSAPMPSRS